MRIISQIDESAQVSDSSNIPDIVIEKKFHTKSFSALETYKTCPQLYKYKYIDKIATPKPLEKALLVGSWTHKLIEELLNNPESTVEEQFKVYIYDWIAECSVSLSSSDIDNLIELSVGLKDLLYRASSMCVDSTKIRNSNGTVLKSPIDYPSNSLKSEFSKLKCWQYKSQLDQKACQQNKDFLSISFCWLFAEALFNAYSFKIPTWVEETLYTELEFGTTENNKVPLGTFEDIGEVSLLGYIDWVVKLKDGRVAIIDHKTSTKMPTNEEVLFHPQLNLYAYAYKILFGEYPHIIGINHIKSGNLVLADTHVNIIHSNLDYYENLCLQTLKLTSNTPLRKHPNDYQTPCVKKDYNTNKIISTCPYLDKCWGMYQKLIRV